MRWDTLQLHAYSYYVTVRYGHTYSEVNEPEPRCTARVRACVCVSHDSTVQYNT